MSNMVDPMEYKYTPDVNPSDQYRQSNYNNKDARGKCQCEVLNWPLLRETARGIRPARHKIIRQCQKRTYGLLVAVRKYRERIASLLQRPKPIVDNRESVYLMPFAQPFRDEPARVQVPLLLPRWPV